MEGRRGEALVLDNWAPTTRGVRIRGGASRHATLDAAVVSMFGWAPETGNRKVFAATATKIYDVTLPADPLVTPTADVTGRRSGKIPPPRCG